MGITPPVVIRFLASIHVSTFYFRGADKDRMKLINMLKFLLLAYFCQVLATWGVREAVDHAPQIRDFNLAERQPVYLALYSDSP